ncbi:MAG: glycosyltransferase [Planctomycetes bacterium]|nr:glycosyltransferase [Planctomycetota bacterium]
MSYRTVGRLLRQSGFSLRTNVKRLTGPPHPDRDRQFRFLRRVRTLFLRHKAPVISVDTKNSELIGNFKNSGTRWCTQPDVVHAHDWMTYQAGVAIKKMSGKPLTIHVHATEFDRSGGGPVHQTVYDIEKLGMKHADKIIAVSKFTKQKIIDRYAIAPEKIAVIYNAVARKKGNRKPFHANKKNPLVLFLGRLTLQKGPDYFLDVAKKVLEHRDDVDFVIAGSGDMQHRLIECATRWGIGDKVLFTGFLRGQEVDRMYQMADVYVMPSVSEPFGIAALEAMQEGVPLIVSKDAGVSEVVNHCLKIDFWDINRMTDSILAILEHAELSNEMSKNGKAEVKKFCWNKVAQQCIEVYRFII